MAINDIPIDPKKQKKKELPIFRKVSIYLSVVKDIITTEASAFMFFGNVGKNGHPLRPLNAIFDILPDFL